SGGTLISGATSATYAAPTGTAGTTYYYVVVTNTDTGATGQQTATATSSVARVQVNALTNASAPSIDTQPSDKTVNVGGSANLTVAASGGVALSYQWYSNTTNSTSGGTLISGATSATYAAPTGTAGTTYYYVVVTNTDTGATGQSTATATSSVAKVQVNALTNAATPSITTQPSDKTVNVGGSANLTVAASGGVALSYQWYSNTTNSTSGGTLITGATSATYAAPTGTAGTTYYYVVVMNTDVSASGQQTATATSSVARVQVNALTNAAVPSIDTQPSDKTVNVGGTANLTVAASGGVALSYQWYSNTTHSTSGGTLISGATSATYAAPTGTAGTTYYYVIVTNTDTGATGQQTATATSSVAKVQVNALTNAAAPSIDTQPSDKTVNVGGTANLTVAASGGVALSYQWYSNTTNSTSGGTLITGATSATYAAPTGTASTTYYYVVVTNTDTGAKGQQTATATSSVAKVQVNALTNAAAPSITTQPSDKTVNVGGTANLTVAASGGVALSYQWYSNTTNSTSGGTLITGATSATYAAPTGTAGTTYYYVVVTNTDSSATGQNTATATSSVAKVQVNALTNAAAPSIDTQPSDKTVNEGSPATLTVAASGGVTLSYQWYSNTTNSASGGTLITGATSATYAAPTGTAGTTYYYVVVTNTDTGATGQQTATTTSNVAKVQVNALTNASAPSITTQPSDKTVNVGGNANLTVAASGGVALSYQWYSNTTNSTSGGTLITGATSATYAAPTDTAGTTYYYVIVTNTDSSATGQSTATATSSVAKVQVNAAPTPEPTPTPTPTVPETPKSGVEVLVNGKVENAGTATTTKVNDQQVTTITVDQKKLDAKIEAEGQGAIVTIPDKSNANVVVSELNGQMVKNMEGKQATLEIKTESATYTIPAQQFNITSISDQIGKSVALQDIKVRIEIAEPLAATVEVVENAAEKGTFALVAPPVNFNVIGTYGDKTISIEKFNIYVERSIAIPNGVDPNKITTGVVVEPDGTVRHVPTKITKIDGKYYAVINSLTNSTYTVVWHPLEFADVANHWSRAAVNDMGSRMVIEGTGEGQFSPDRSITRAEFAAIIVRGLGLKLEKGPAPFSDVKASAWYNDAINTAYAYRLINGYADGTFGPNDRITREQAMVIIAKAMKLTSLEASLPAQDAAKMLQPYMDASQASVWAIDSIADSVQSGVVTGRSGTTLAPKAYITRAEVAMIIQRLLQKSELI
ncbi:S-layer homology domain-containing protein, partial [Paenibacillus aurantiacus]